MCPGARLFFILALAGSMAVAVARAEYTVTLHPGVYGAIDQADPGPSFVARVAEGGAFPLVTVTPEPGWVLTGWELAFPYPGTITELPATVTYDFQATAVYGRAPYAVPNTNILLTYEIGHGQTTITDCNEDAVGDLEIPAALGGAPVTEIGFLAFADCGLLGSVTIPDSVTTIRFGAFLSCASLTGVTLGDAVTEIGDGAFSACSSLLRVSIPASVATIGSWAFSNCSSLARIEVAGGNLHYAGLDGVLFDHTLVFLHTYPAGKTAPSYTIPDSVTTIGEAAFGHCGALTDAMIPDTVTTVGRYAYASCESLRSVTFGASVARIGEAAFDGCSSLASATFAGDAPAEVGDDAFPTTVPEFTVYYHEGAAGFTTPEWLGYRSEAVPAGPGQAVLLEPGGTIETVRPEFRWQGDPGAEWYQIYIVRDGVYYFDHWTQDTRFSPWWDWENGDYTWYVQTWGDGQAGAWSERMLFTVAAPPPTAPTGLQPHEQELDRNVVAFAWNAVPEADWYYLYVARKGEPYYDGWYNTHEPQDWRFCLEQGSYSWWVQPWRSGVGLGDWSAEATFRIDSPLDPAGQPILLAPAGAVSGDSPTFTWSGATDTQWTWIVIHKDGEYYFDYWIPIADTWSTWWQFDPGAYQWWCVGWNAKHGVGTWSDPAEFAVE